MLALKIMPLVDFSAIVWVAPVLVAALSVFILNERVGPGLWVSVFTGLAGVWVIVGLPRHGFFVFPPVSIPSRAHQRALSDHDTAFARDWTCL